MSGAKTYTYVELMVDRGILRKDSKLIEGCTGSIGFDASLHVAGKLGPNAEYYMVTKDPSESRSHRREFTRNYNPDPESRDKFIDLCIGASLRHGINIDMARIMKESGLPNIGWVVGYIEDQAELIKRCDILLFHNHVPTSIHDRSWDGENGIVGGTKQRMFFERIIDMGAKTIVIYLPDFKKPEAIMKVLESLKVRCEIFSNIDYAGKWVGKFMYDVPNTSVSKEGQKLTGKAIIATLRA